MEQITYDKFTIDSIFKRDWILEEEVIYELLTMVDQETWLYLKDQCDKYPEIVRYVIRLLDDETNINTTGIEVVELTDIERRKIDAEQKRKNEEDFEKIWKAHKESIPERSLSKVDGIADECWEALIRAKEDLHKFTSSKKKSYVSPSQRNKVVKDSTELKLEAEVERLENEFKQAEKNIAQEDDEYYNEKKCEFRKEMLFKMFEKTPDSHNM